MKRYILIFLMTIVALASTASVYNFLNVVKADGTGNSFAATGVKITFAGNNITVNNAGKSSTISLGKSGYLEFSNTDLGAPSGVKGDVNGDGVVDVTDVNCLVNIVLGNVDAAIYSGRANINGDNVVDVADINAIITIIIGV